MATVLDGKACAKAIEEELRASVSALAAPPVLALVLVGDNADSKTYIRLKKNACTRVGITPQVHEVPAAASAADLRALLAGLAADAAVHGVLLQLPLPAHLQPLEEELLESIPADKDVDGLHSRHFARLADKKPVEAAPERLRLEPCTPAGCLELLKRHGVALAGKRAVVVGRGKLVGLPLSLLLLGEHATVTTCHAQTADLEAAVRQAELLFVAAGRPELVKGDWVAPGAVVVDVGINYVDDAGSKRGYKILGDVEFVAASARAAAITPVPGGIGPMTIAMLLKNTVACAAFAQRAAQE